jgi:DNA-binding HxlR family transcriptional regulator
MSIKTHSSATCPIYCVIEKFSKKWSLHIIRSFTENKKLRFLDIMKALPEINSRVLTERLKELEEGGLIARKEEGEKPVVTYYEITEKVMDFQKVFTGVIQWAKKWEDL